ncbi:MAG: amino acid adenylation domain-containing protein, partial [bacterium]|nr:amino acid adenylation domain-containing protein [bacterium]
VATRLERSAAMVVTLLAIVKAGGYYVPLDLDYPAERVAFMLADSGAPVLVTDQRLAGDLPAGAAEVISLEAEAAAIARRPAADPPPRSSGESLAYAIYTSGSTGRPKGVAVPQQAVSRLVLGSDYVQLTPRDRVAQASNASFDAATFEIWGALLNGACLVGISKEVALSPPDLAAHLRTRGITAMFVTTALFNRLVQESPSVFGGVRQVLFGGEAVDPEPARKLLAGEPPERLLHVYGPTESTTFTSWYRVREVAPGALTIAIGRPIANTRIHVVEPSGREAPLGVHGELLVGGDGLARGYLGRPQLTAEKIVPDPFSAAPGGRLYRTGDLVRRRSDGAIEFLGRIDFQVKIRGFRIELGEIEAVLGRHPAVSEAVVIVREVSQGDRRLVAFVVAASADPGALRGFLKEKLPEHMVPSVFVELPALPLNPNNKVDRAALDRQALPELTGAETAFVAPRTPTEEVMAGIWSRILQLEGIGVDHDFFELGGHSLLATQVISRVREAFQREIPLRQLFETPTVAGLAEVVERTRAEGRSIPPLHPIPRDERGMPRDPVPLSFAQERLWFLDQLDPGSPTYNIPSAVRLTGRLEVPVLLAGLEEIVRRHESLRTTFAPGDDGSPVQVISPVPFSGWQGQTTPEVGRTTSRSVKVPRSSGVEKFALVCPGTEQGQGVPDAGGGGIPRHHRSPDELFQALPLPPLGFVLVDIEPLAAAAREAESRRLAAQEARRPFDLTRGPLLRVTLLRLAPAEHVMLFTVHHIVSDGWSMGVLIREVAALYGALAAGKPSPLAERSVQYADFAVWQRQWLAGEVLEQELEYWKEQLTGAPHRLELPTDRPRPAVQTFRGRSRPCILSPELSASLTALSRHRGATLYMTLLAGFQVLLSRTTGSDDVSVGSPIAGRNHREIEDLIGFFVNTLVLRAVLSAGSGDGEPSFRRLLARVRQVALDAYAHQDLPFERLVDELQPQRDLSTSPLFQVAFALQNASQETLELPGLTLSAMAVEGSVAKFDLTLSLDESAGGISGGLEYNVDLFDATTMDRFLAHLERLLEGVVEDPERRLSELPWWTEASRHQLLVEWNDTPGAAADARSVHELFEAQVRRAPDAVAVEYGRERVSYRELDARADRLARELAGLGVKPDVLVALVNDSSPEMLVALLGILKAGGAYLPIDPAYPRERVDFMVEDSGAALVLNGDEPAPAAGPPRSGVAAGTVAPGNLPFVPLRGNLAYVIYTSGSTGRPKGVSVTHGTLMNLVRWHQQSYLVRAGDRATQIAGPAFDASVWEIWPYLAAGATLCIPEPEIRSAPARLVSWLVSRSVDVSFLPTPLAELTLAEPWPSGSALRAVLTGGEQLHRRPPPGLGFELINHYGPTENTVVATCGRVAPAGERTDMPDIGRPIAGVRVYLLDRSLRPVPPSAAGELMIGGGGLARGYLERPGLTAECFVPDPFGGDALAAAGGRLYRTGDLARYRADGTIEFLGRIDHQVKIRGFRIELGE